MKKSFFYVAALIALVFISGCHSINWNLPQGFDYQHSMDRIAIVIEPVKVSGKFEVDPAIIKKMNAFLAHKFKSSSRFVVLAGISGQLAETQNKILKISPIVLRFKEQINRQYFHYCQVSVTCALYDLETGTFSSNGADEICVSKNSTAVPAVNFYGRDHYDVRTLDSKVDEALNALWDELDIEIAAKYPANAKISSVQSIGNQTTFAIAAGVANGFRNDDVFKIYTVKNGIATVVALASGQIGKSHSTLTVTEWNMDDLRVKEIYYPRIMNNDIKDLYVVTEKRREKN